MACTRKSDFDDFDSVEVCPLIFCYNSLISTIAWKDANHASLYYMLSCIGSISLFPLLFKVGESTTKVVIALIYAILIPFYLNLLLGKRKASITFGGFEKVYLFGAIVVFCVTSLLELRPLSGYDFLPLMMNSVYSALGIVYCWMRLSWNFLFERL